MRRRFWYSESSVAADKPDDLLSEPEFADDNTLLTLAYATGDLGYAVGNAEDSLFDKTCSALMPYISKVNTLPRQNAPSRFLHRCLGCHASQRR
jgi:hypothetical protein